MKPEGSSPYPEPDESSPHIQTLNL